MASVGFAIGATPGSPGLSAGDADDLARLLEVARNTVAVQLADRIRQQARLNPNAGEISTNLTLDRAELEQIVAVFTDGPDLLAIPAYAHLFDEVRRELARR